ncbi:MAG: ABC transporter permease [Lentisphaerae bacterium]|nr:ABC transporter permease [Lentisphaerota bacterium]
MAILPLRIALRALRRNKVRSSLTVLGIIVGTAALIAVMAVGQGASVMVREQIESMGSNMVLVFPGSMRTGGAHSGAGGRQSLTAADGDAIAAECPGVVAVCPVIRSWTQVVYRDNNWRSMTQGVTPSYREIRGWSMQGGEFFQEADVRGATRVCVIGGTVADNLFAGEDPVGKVVRLNSMPFRVVGVLARKGTAAWGQDQDDTILAPATTVARVLEGSPFNSVSQLMIGVATAEIVPDVIQDIESLLRQRHRVRTPEDDDFTVMDLTEITETVTQVSRLMTVMLSVIASISLLVGGIGIMNIMLVSVTERTREIGVRMAVGASPRDIMLQFLVEAIVLSALGAVVGVALGAGAAGIISRVNNWPVLVSLSSIGLAMLFAGLIGVFFGWYPAWRASRLNPIECLRHE